MGSEDLIFFQIKSKHKMLSVKLITLVLSMAMFSHGKTVQQCNSCCPTPTPPDEDAITCDKLGEHLDKLDDAIAEGSCDEVEGQQSDAVCNAFTKAIPPCMVLKGGVKQSECLAEKASDLGDEEIVTNCKCKAFRNIRNTVGSVKNMMCVDSRESKFWVWLWNEHHMVPISAVQGYEFCLLLLHSGMESRGFWAILPLR